MSEIRDLVQEFTTTLTALVDAQTRARVEAIIMAAVGTPTARRRGRPSQVISAEPPAAVAPSAKKARKKMPRQLCPVPGCTNTAAPIFGMVCSKHRDVPKRLIKKYREARKAKKLAAAGKPLKKRKTKKVVRAKPVSPPKKVQTKPGATAKKRKPRPPKTVASSAVASSPTPPLPSETTSST